MNFFFIGLLFFLSFFNFTFLQSSDCWVSEELRNACHVRLERESAKWFNFTECSGEKKHRKDYWNRAQEVAKLIPENSVVLDIGCNCMPLKAHLLRTNKLGPGGASNYIPVDRIRKGEDTRICDLNEGEIPYKRNATIIALIGVENYICSPFFLYKALRQLDLPIIVTFWEAKLEVLSSSPSGGSVLFTKSENNQYENKFTREDWGMMVGNAGFVIKKRVTVVAGGNLRNYYLFHLVPKTPETWREFLARQRVPDHQNYQTYSGTKLGEDEQRPSPLSYLKKKRKERNFKSDTRRTH